MEHFFPCMLNMLVDDDRSSRKKGIKKQQNKRKTNINAILKRESDTINKKLDNMIISPQIHKLNNKIKINEENEWKWNILK